MVKAGFEQIVSGDPFLTFFIIVLFTIYFALINYHML